MRYSAVISRLIRLKLFIFKFSYNLSIFSIISNDAPISTRLFESNVRIKIKWSKKWVWCQALLTRWEILLWPVDNNMNVKLFLNFLRHYAPWSCCSCFLYCGQLLPKISRGLFNSQKIWICELILPTNWFHNFPNLKIEFAFTKINSQSLELRPSNSPHSTFSSQFLHCILQRQEWAQKEEQIEPLFALTFPLTKCIHKTSKSIYKI